MSDEQFNLLPHACRITKLTGEARGRVFGALPFVAVRQQHHHTVHTLPLGFAGENKLVDDCAGAVGEVAELRFPQHQGVGIDERVTVFKTKHRVFGKRSVL